ncbi:hypothetical protein ACGFNU_34015 [Spirillospora sp. NPDC048911]|uniref:hypothetical protein n=1 Tax=Spirillospora sp. NPDC048911 TaxID=3364527 RepID=UPI00371809D9
MSAHITKLIRAALAGAVLTTGLTAALVTSTGSSASARACHEGGDLYLFEGAVYGEHFRYCSPPGELEHPLGVVVERRVNSTTWVTVAKGSGVALYQCTGTGSRTYRLQKPSRQITVPCS